jgi:hypothetical protein
LAAVSLPDDLADRGSLLANPVEHLADDAGFIEHNLEAGGAAAFVLLDVAMVKRMRSAATWLSK